MNNVEKLQQLVKNLPQNIDASWLDKFNPSQAFLICMGAGPWKINRRQKIQKQAINILQDRDLCQVQNANEFKYPLLWQIQKTQAMIDYLRDQEITMMAFVDWLKITLTPVETLYAITKTKGRAKVLDLYARDYLKIEAFPIDRWVKRILMDNGFPVDERYMIELCKKAELNPSEVARQFVSAGGFTGNAEL